MLAEHASLSRNLALYSGKHPLERPTPPASRQASLELRGFVLVKSWPVIKGIDQKSQRIALTECLMGLKRTINDIS
jgi:hypothetical protein